MQARAWPARPRAAAGAGAWAGAAGGLIQTQPVTVQAAQRPQPGNRLRPGFSGPGQNGMIVRVNT